MSENDYEVKALVLRPNTVENLWYLPSKERHMVMDYLLAKSCSQNIMHDDPLQKYLCDLAWIDASDFWELLFEVEG